MKTRAIAALLGLTFLASAQVHAEETMFTGDKKLACEAVMCLSSGKRPEECSPSVQKYLSIKFKKAWKTAAKRQEFLEMCPQGDVQATPEQMDKALEAIGMAPEDEDNAEE